MPYSTSSSWILAARRAANAQANLVPGTAVAIAERLIKLHELMLDMPGPLKTVFEHLREDSIAPIAGVRAAELYADHWAWEVPVGCTQERAVLIVTAEIRALDERLSDHQQLLGHPLESRIDVRSWTLVRRNPAWRVPTPKHRYPYARRALVYHRALPKNLDGYSINLVELNDARLKPMRLAAALAPGVKHHTTKANGHFRITQIDFPDGEKVTREQLIESAKDGSWAHVWPELTIGPELRAKIATTLGEWDMDATDQPPALVITGSCHEWVGSQIVNRAWLLDAYGDRRAHFDKLLPYVTKKDGAEDIKPGKELIVLITSGPAIAIGICKDLCDATREIFALDIDLVVVPSMGDSATTSDHLAAIRSMRNSYGPEAFVVQQADPNARRRTNYVISPKSDLRKSARAMATKKSWSSHDWV